MLLPFRIIDLDTIQDISKYHITFGGSNLPFHVPPNPRDYVLHGHGSLPLSLDGGGVVIDAAINGKGPYSFILDTGGSAIFTTEAATAWHLKQSGSGLTGGAGVGTVNVRYAKVSSIRIAGAELLNQPVLVIPYGYSLEERGLGRRISGILGEELLERFVTKIDYGTKRVSFTLPRKGRSRTAGGTVPIFFTDDVPQLWAFADGIRGVFQVDTGNGGPTYLFGDFLKAPRFHEPLRRRLNGLQPRNRWSRPQLQPST